MSSASDAHDSAKKEKAETFFQYGNDAALKANFDYAIQMYQAACKEDPAKLLYRQALRGVARKKFGNDPNKVGRLVGLSLKPIRMKARSAKSKGNNEAALAICEEAFALSPWDVNTAWEASEAALAINAKDVAEWLIDSVFPQANDSDFFKFAAQIYEQCAAWPKAIVCWERVKKINPNDEEASRQINALSASATIQRSGLNESLNKQDIAAKALPKEAEDLRVPSMTPEQRWEKDIAENPTHVGPYLHYADYLKEKNQLDAAEKVLARGLKANPDDGTLLYTYADVQISRLHAAEASWSKKCAAAPNDLASKSKLEQIRKMLSDYEIKEYRRRAAISPGDGKIQYELGLRLVKAKLFKDAIGAFQLARNHAALKVEAHLQLGICFEEERSLKLAERNFADALKALSPDDTALFNEIHYRLGRVNEELGNTSAAEEHYNEVAANDYGYKDVANRLRGLN